MKYDENYYRENSQDGDRPALWMYERMWRRYLNRGPILEFGCGVGYFARRLACHAEIYGLETNPYALKQIETVAPDVNVVTDISDLKDKSIGSVVALHVFEHIPDDELMSIGTELNRVLTPGGRMLVVMPDLCGRAHTLKGSKWSAFGDPTHINLKPAKDWNLLFQDQWMFKIVASFADGYYDFPYGANRVISGPGDVLRAARTLAQFLLAKPILSQGDGENIVFILERSL